jgi:UDP-galactopyranose mutase
MYLIIGSGLSGAVLAERIANELNEKVIIIEKRNHLAGNCFDYKDEETDILMNAYGSHLFHTNSDRVWEYIQNFSKWVPWYHKVLSYVDDKYVPVPVNLITLSELCGKYFSNSKEAKEYLEEIQIPFDNPINSEEMGLSRVGKELYDKMFKPYTYKQWAKYPEELDPSVLSRIPVRFDADPRYFTDKYQALPESGYTKFVENMLNNQLITVHLNTDFEEYKKQNDITKFKGIIYTGPIDEYFKDKNLEKLEYRSIEFKKKVILSDSNLFYFQPATQVNYPEDKYSFTRITEYKHLLNQKAKGTVLVYEESCDKGEPYYPVPTDANKKIYEQYRKLAEEEEQKNNVFFVGRLANYKYFNMDEAILNALTIFEEKICKI